MVFWKCNDTPEFMTPKELQGVFIANYWGQGHIWTLADTCQAFNQKPKRRLICARLDSSIVKPPCEETSA